MEQRNARLITGLRVGCRRGELVNLMDAMSPSADQDFAGTMATPSRVHSERRAQYPPTEPAAWPSMAASQAVGESVQRPLSAGVVPGSMQQSLQVDRSAVSALPRMEGQRWMGNTMPGAAFVSTSDPL